MNSDVLWYFVVNPSHYWAPMVINLVLLILNARFLHHLYREAKMLMDPIVIFGVAILWPLFDMGLFVVGTFWLMGKVIGFLIGKRS